METLTGPIFYMLVAWGIVTAIFLLLLIWRSLLESHEDDQIFIEASGDRMAKEQRDLIQKINTLSRPIMASGVAAGGLLLFIAGFWLYQGLKNFFFHFSWPPVSLAEPRFQEQCCWALAPEQPVSLKCDRARSASGYPS